MNHRRQPHRPSPSMSPRRSTLGNHPFSLSPSFVLFLLPICARLRAGDADKVGAGAGVGVGVGVEGVLGAGARLEACDGDGGIGRHDATIGLSWQTIWCSGAISAILALGKTPEPHLSS
ncbi:uncharacterized protein J3R85_005738 [Psidium guajava]|nr:uncharacterized protein J3R85_005738 [Psidium guajava]